MTDEIPVNSIYHFVSIGEIQKYIPKYIIFKKYTSIHKSAYPTGPFFELPD